MDNIHPFHDRARIEAEAREWLIRLDSDTPPSDHEAEALREWLNRSPAHRRELKRISEFWDRANILTELAVPLSRVEDRPQTRGAWIRSRLFNRPAMAAAALVVMLLAAGTVLIPGLQPDPGTTGKGGVYGTGIGQLRTVTLADGSRAELNTDSLIEVGYNGAVRKIRLLRGESHFKVRHVPGKAFEVYAGGNMVRAVGTAFSVQLLNDDVKVTVDEGRVELIAVKQRRIHDDDTNSRPDMEVLGTLQHGQTATIGRTVDKIANLAEDELARQLSWRQGVLSFSGEPLSEVVDKINRYTPKTIEIADPELKSLPVGGRFRVSELERVFEVLKSSFNIRVSRVGDQHILLRSEKQK